MKAKSSKSHKKRGVTNLEPILVECSIGQISYIDSLIETSTLQENEFKEIKDKANGFLSEGEAEELITYLIENQRDSILYGFNYQMSDIKNKIQEKLNDPKA